MKVYKERLKKLSFHLKKVPSILFNIDHYIDCRKSKIDELFDLDKRCGGTACPIGWLAKIFPEQFYIDDTLKLKDNLHIVVASNKDVLWNAIGDFFGIDDYDIAMLFTREGYDKFRIGPRDVVDKINYLIKTQM